MRTSVYQDAEGRLAFAVFRGRCLISLDMDPTGNDRYPYFVGYL